MCLLFLRRAMELKDFFKENPRAALAFSGGVDSAYLMYAASKYAKEFKAYYVRSDFQPEFEFEDAVRLAKELKADMEVIKADVLKDDRIAVNMPDRCYHCKKLIFNKIIEAAAADGFKLIMDGTNASDDASDRPGMRALKELYVRSPLRECGLTKDEIRRLSKEAGLFTHDKPSYACLATRIPVGIEIGKEALIRVEKAEDYLMSLGFKDLRVRTTVDGNAKLQLKKPDMEKLMDMREDIVKELKKYFPCVMLDLEERT